jgi:hypothetical protein
MGLKDMLIWSFRYSLFFSSLRGLLLPHWIGNHCNLACLCWSNKFEEIWSNYGLHCHTAFILSNDILCNTYKSIQIFKSYKPVWHFNMILFLNIKVIYLLEIKCLHIKMLSNLFTCWQFLPDFFSQYRVVMVIGHSFKSRDISCLNVISYLCDCENTKIIDGGGQKRP